MEGSFLTRTTWHDRLFLNFKKGKGKKEGCDLNLGPFVLLLRDFIVISWWPSRFLLILSYYVFIMNSSLHDYEVLNVVGSGSFGTCYKVKNILSNEIFVWKAIDYGRMSEEKKKVSIYCFNLLTCWILNLSFYYLFRSSDSSKFLTFRFRYW